MIIDFIDLHKAQNKQALYDEMVKLMSTDKAKHTVLPLTKFGLMQITRQRVVRWRWRTSRTSARRATVRKVETYGAAGQEDRESDLVPDRKTGGHKFIKLVVSPYVASYLRKGFWSLRRRWEWKYKVRLKIVEDQSTGIIEVHYHDRKDNDLIEL